MRKTYECPEIEIIVIRFTDCILTSIESDVNSEIHEFIESTGEFEDL